LPANLITATTAGQTLVSTATKPTTLLGNNLATNFIGSTNETNFVSGYGAHKLQGGAGANIYTYLAIADSTPSVADTIWNFDPAKDVIDLSRIDANITAAGLQQFTFIGTAHSAAQALKCDISWIRPRTRPTSRSTWPATPAISPPISKS
jgi:hypothetical protein